MVAPNVVDASAVVPPRSPHVINVEFDRTKSRWFDPTSASTSSLAQLQEGTNCNGATNPGVMKVIADNSEKDFEGIHTQVIVPASSVSLRAAGADASNRFFCFATDSEDEQIHQRTLLDEDICSDTVSLVGQRNS